MNRSARRPAWLRPAVLPFLVVLGMAAQAGHAAPDPAVLDLRDKGFPTIEAALASVTVADKAKVGAILLAKNRIRAIRGLEGFPNLKVLDLADNGIEGLEGIPQLPSIEVLVLSRNPIVSLKGIESFPSLRTLDVFSYDLTSYEGIQKLRNLWSLVSWTTGKVASYAPLISLFRMGTLRYWTGMKTDDVKQEDWGRLTTAAGDGVERMVFDFWWHDTGVQLPADYDEHFGYLALRVPLDPGGDPAPSRKEGKSDEANLGYDLIWRFETAVAVAEGGYREAVDAGAWISTGKSREYGGIKRTNAVKNGDARVEIVEDADEAGTMVHRGIRCDSTPMTVRYDSFQDGRMVRISAETAGSVKWIGGYRWAAGSSENEYSLEDGSLQYFLSVDAEGRIRSLDLSHPYKAKNGDAVYAFHTRYRFQEDGSLATVHNFYNDDDLAWSIDEYDGKGGKNRVTTHYRKSKEVRYVSVLYENGQKRGVLYHLPDGKKLPDAQYPLSNDARLKEIPKVDSDFYFIVDSTVPRALVSDSGICLGRTPISLRRAGYLGNAAAGVYLVACKVPGYADRTASVNDPKGRLNVLSMARFDEKTYDAARVVRLRIMGTPTQAAASMDHLPLGDTPLVWQANVGDTFQVKLKANGVEAAFPVAVTKEMKGAAIVELPFDAEERIVVIRTAPTSGASIKADGKDVGKSPAEHRVFGRKRIQIAAESNGVTATLAFQVGDPGRQEAAVPLDAEERTVLIRTAPTRHAAVKVDGKDAGTSPVECRVFGQHKIEIAAESHGISVRKAYQVAGAVLQETELAIDAEPRTVSVTSWPSGATVTYAGKVLGQTPLEATVFGKKAFLFVTMDNFDGEALPLTFQDETRIERHVNLPWNPQMPSLAPPERADAGLIGAGIAWIGAAGESSEAVMPFVSADLVLGWKAGSDMGLEYGFRVGGIFNLGILGAALEGGVWLGPFLLYTDIGCQGLITALTLQFTASAGVRFEIMEDWGLDASLQTAFFSVGYVASSLAMLRIGAVFTGDVFRF